MNKNKEFSFSMHLETFFDSTKIWEDGRIMHIKAFVDRKKDLEFHIYPKDHFPAHFHVISKQRNIDARFDLYTFELLSEKKGSISKDDEKKVKAFFETREYARKKLYEKYEQLQKE